MNTLIPQPIRLRLFKHVSRIKCKYARKSANYNFESINLIIIYDLIYNFSLNEKITDIDLIRLFFLENEAELSVKCEWPIIGWVKSTKL